MSSDEDELAQLRQATRYQRSAASAVQRGVHVGSTAAPEQDVDYVAEAPLVKPPQEDHEGDAGLPVAFGRAGPVHGFSVPPRKHGGGDGDDNSNSDNDDSREASDDEDEIFPFNLEVKIPAHHKAVTAVTLDPKGSRMATGGADGVIKLWDFHGMKSDTKCFREVTPVEDHRVQALNFNQSGGILLVTMADAVSRQLDRDGVDAGVTPTIKGDSYIRDLQHTRGHTQMLTDGRFHDVNPNRWWTSSVDGSVRLWDINGEITGIDQHLCCEQVLTCLDKRNVCSGGSGKTGSNYPMCIATSLNAKMVVAGCSDGSVQLFNEKRVMRKPDKICRKTAHLDTVTGIAMFDNHLSTRAIDGTLKIWDLRQFSEKNGPLVTIGDLPNDMDKCSVSFSPDGEYVVTGTSCDPKAKGKPAGSAVIFSVSTHEEVKRASFPDASVIRSLWHQHLNQMIVTMSDGSVRMLYDKKQSHHGALLFVGKQPTRVKDVGTANIREQAFAVTDRDSLSAGGFKLRYDGTIKEVKKPRMTQEAKDKSRQLAPERPTGRPAVDGKGAEVVKSNFLTTAYIQAFGKNMVHQTDSQQALLAVADQADKAGGVINSAYATSQPHNTLDFSEVEFAADKMLQKKRYCPMCGLKLCKCGYMAKKGLAEPEKPAAKRTK